MNNFLQALDNNLPPLLLALAGGLADFLTSDDHRLGTLIIGLFLAGFAGYIVLLLCIEYKLSTGWTGINVGVSGLASRSLIKIFKMYAKKRAEKLLNEEPK